MYIKRKYVDFSSDTLPGRFSTVLELDSNGTYIDKKDIVNMIYHFNNVVIKGDEELEQKNEIDYIIKNTAKKNPRCSFIIYVNGTQSPHSLAKYNNVNFIVNIQLKTSGIKYKARIIPDALGQYNQLHSHFIFDIFNINEIDEVMEITTDIGIYKANIYLKPDSCDTNLLNDVYQKCLYHSYNFILPITIEMINKECGNNEEE